MPTIEYRSVCTCFGCNSFSTLFIAAHGAGGYCGNRILMVVVIYFRHFEISMFAPCDVSKEMKICARRYIYIRKESYLTIQISAGLARI